MTVIPIRDAVRTEISCQAEVLLGKDDYLNCAGQGLEDSLLLNVHKEDLTVLLHCCQDVWACRIPCKEQKCTLFELCGGSSFASPYVPNPGNQV